MATGRPDYWYRISPEKTVFGTEQQSWEQSIGISLAPGEAQNLLEYTVAVGYVLFITDIIFNCDVPGIDEFKLYTSTTAFDTFYYDQLFVLNLSEGGYFVVTAGNQLKVSVKNNDSVTINYTIILSGYLVKV